MKLPQSKLNFPDKHDIDIKIRSFLLRTISHKIETDLRAILYLSSFSIAQVYCCQTGIYYRQRAKYASKCEPPVISACGGIIFMPETSSSTQRISRLYDSTTTSKAARHCPDFKKKQNNFQMCRYALQSKCCKCWSRCQIPVLEKDDEFHSYATCRLKDQVLGKC